MLLSDQTRKMTEEFIAGLPAKTQAIVQQAFGEIMESDAGNNALTVEDQASDFSLPNAKGKEVRLSELLEHGPVVLNFYRGGWCPYCNMEFRALQEVLPRIQALGATLVGISPELPDNSLKTIEKHQLEFEVLSDIGNKVARQYGIVMDVPEIMRPLYLQWGLDVPESNGDDTWELPIPAVYVINKDRSIAAAYVNKNYTERMEPADMIEAVEALTVSV